MIDFAHILQPILNQSIKDNPLSIKILKCLSGKIVSWHYRSIGLTFIFSSTSIFCKKGISKSANVTLNYNPVEITKIYRALSTNKPIPKSITISQSEVSLLSSLQQLFKVLDINLDSILKTLTDNQFLLLGARKIQDNTINIVKNNTSATLDYLKYEKEIFVTKEEADDFYHRIRDLQSKIDKIKKDLEVI